MRFSFGAMLRQFSFFILPVVCSAAPAATLCDESSCGGHGTGIQWVAPPQAAADQAGRQDKLLMVMHLSGNFTKMAFT